MNLELRNRSEIEREIVGALKSAMDAHGPITPANVNSAAKRVYKTLGSLAKRQRDKQDPSPTSPLAQEVRDEQMGSENLRPRI